MRILLPLRWHHLAALLVLATLTFAGCDSEGTNENSAEVRVMTYNIYLGAEIFALVGTPLEDIPAVAGALFTDVRESNFPARADAIADIIQEENPDLIGLQEVTWYRSGPGNDPAPATQNEFNFLDILLAALEANGLDYEVAATTTNADVEIPAIVDGGLRDIRLTDRDVILARSDIEISETVEQNFSDGVTAPVPIGGMDVPFARGYNYVRATVDDVTFTFVNAHLEVDDGNPQGAALAQFGQAAELLSVLDAVPGPSVLVGDFNSAADGSGTEISTPLFSGTTYGLLTRNYSDAGEAAGATGDTCCQDADLRNDMSSLSQRIDLILTRGNIQVVQASAEVVGDEPADRTADGLWPSDHAGVVATVEIGG